MHLLSRLDEAGLTPEERALIDGVAEQYLELRALLGKPGVTLTELRARGRSAPPRG